METIQKTFKNSLLRYFKKGLITLLFMAPVFSYALAETNRGTPSQFMRHEHDQIYARVERLAKTPGKTGKAAQNLLTVMRPHMFKEEDFVLPELAVLKNAALGGSTEGMAWAIRCAENLKKEYPQMLAEHQAIFKSIGELKQAADLDGDQSAMELASQLKAHIQDEEDIVYPAAILAGEHIKQHSLHALKNPEKI